MKITKHTYFLVFPPFFFLPLPHSFSLFFPDLSLSFSKLFSMCLGCLKPSPVVSMMERISHAID